MGKSMCRDSMWCGRAGFDDLANSVLVFDGVPTFRFAIYRKRTGAENMVLLRSQNCLLIIDGRNYFKTMVEFDLSD